MSLLYRNFQVTSENGERRIHNVSSDEQRN